MGLQAQRTNADWPEWHRRPAEGRRVRRGHRVNESRRSAGRHLGRPQAYFDHLKETQGRPKSDVAGRVQIIMRKGEDGQVATLRIRGPRTIIEALADKPTVLPRRDAPQLNLLRPWYPALALTSTSNAECPTPTSEFAGRLQLQPEARGDAPDRHIRNVHRYILKRWLECGTAEKTLVVAQEKVEGKLRLRGLPSSVHVEHFNDLRGRDIYKDADLLIVVGRPLPLPRELEPLAGALLGYEPILATKLLKTEDAGTTLSTAASEWRTGTVSGSPTSSTRTPSSKRSVGRRAKRNSYRISAGSAASAARRPIRSGSTFSTASPCL